jgi:hypothetical protein
MTAIFGDQNSDLLDQFIDSKTKQIENIDMAILFIKKLTNLGLVKENEIALTNVTINNPFQRVTSLKI